MIYGKATMATGTLTSLTASLLSFTQEMHYVCICNTSGKTAHILINDTTPPTVSTTKRDIALADGQSAFLDQFAVKTIGVYVEATSGVTASGRV